MAEARGAGPRTASSGRAPGARRGPRGARARCRDFSRTTRRAPYPEERRPPSPRVARVGALRTLCSVNASLCSGAGILGPAEAGGLPNSLLRQRDRISAGPPSPRAAAGRPRQLPALKAGADILGTSEGANPATLCSEKRIGDPRNSGDLRGREPRDSAGGRDQGLPNRANPATCCSRSRIGDPGDGFLGPPTG